MKESIRRSPPATDKGAKTVTEFDGDVGDRLLVKATGVHPMSEMEIELSLS
jgi:hypothetical protein